MSPKNMLVLAITVLLVVPTSGCVKSSTVADYSTNEHEFYVHTGFTFHNQNLFAGTFDIAAYDSRLKMLEEIGVDGIRIEVWWRTVEPQEGAWDFSKYGAICESARKHNMKVIMVPDFSRFPAWIENKHRLRNSEGAYSSQALDMSSPEVQEYYSIFLQEVKDHLGSCGAGISTASVAITRYSDTIYPSYPEWGKDSKFYFWMYGNTAKEEHMAKFNREVPLQFASLGEKEYMETMRWYVDRKLEWHKFAMQKTKDVFGKCTIAGTGKADINKEDWKTPAGFYRLMFSPDGQRMYDEGVEIGCDGFITAFNGNENPNEIHVYLDRWDKAGGEYMWGENVGGEREGNPVDPLDMANYVIKTGRNITLLYWGDEYLFDENGQPTNTYFKLRNAIKIVNSE
ncbi:MAG: beta-galactosidase [Candidatus Aenigmarchaeota archaeon]|nr:beta-galactosidase [Candidatus Aenigmarchaeota archaeon]